MEGLVPTFDQANQNLNLPESIWINLPSASYTYTSLMTTNQNNHRVGPWSNHIPTQQNHQKSLRSSKSPEPTAAAAEASRHAFYSHQNLR